MKWAKLAALFFFAACATQNTNKNFGATGTTDVQKQLFPYGTYNHRIHVEVKGRADFNFRGIVQLSAGEIKVIGLSPFNTTMFRLTDDRVSGKINTEVYEPAVQKIVPQIEAFYPQLRGLFTREASPVEAWTITTSQGDVRVSIESYDEHHVPSLVKLENDKFIVNVEVVGYEI